MLKQRPSSVENTRTEGIEFLDTTDLGIFEHLLPAGRAVGSLGLVHTVGVHTGQNERRVVDCQARRYTHSRIVSCIQTLTADFSLSDRYDAIR